MTTLNTYAVRGTNGFIPTWGQGVHISESVLLAPWFEVRHGFNFCVCLFTYV